MGPNLENVPDISWDYVKKEKAADMLHVLQFPYNGESPRVSTMYWWKSVTDKRDEGVFVDLENRNAWLRRRSLPTIPISFAIMAASPR